MLGLRGIRLGLMIPDLIKMQTRAILNAAIARKQAGGDPHAEIMIPLVGHVNELAASQTVLEAEAKKVEKSAGTEVDYMFGTMIEMPRGALTADEIAKFAQFFSFGTNDLTQMAFGYSRDDAEGGFLLAYVERGILPANPFQTLDVEGVGQLVRTAVEKGRVSPAEPQDRHLRRARRRPGVDRILRLGGARLRELLAVSSPGGAAGRGPGSTCGRRRARQVALRTPSSALSAFPSECACRGRWS